MRPKRNRSHSENGRYSLNKDVKGKGFKESSHTKPPRGGKNQNPLIGRVVS